MKNSAGDDLSSREKTCQDASQEKVIDIALTELHPFPDHPFKIRDDDAMKETVESIQKYGILTSAIVRPREEGGYEIIAGHRRKYASEQVGLTSMPCLVRDVDEDLAIILMVDSNIQRENILPSEKAKAYKMKIEAIKRRAGRPSKEEINAIENGGQVGHNFRGVKSRDIVAENLEDSARTVQRYIRLTELSPPLQQMVDDKRMAFTPAVELSYLKPEEQEWLVETIESEQATPSLSQAQRIKKLSQTGELNEDTIFEIMTEQKKPEKFDLTIPVDKLRPYFPRNYSLDKMEETIFKLLDNWRKRRLQHNQER